jgi:hypothetical protein
MNDAGFDADFEVDAQAARFGRSGFAAGVVVVAHVKAK